MNLSIFTFLLKNLKELLITVNTGYLIYRLAKLTDSGYQANYQVF